MIYILIYRLLYRLIILPGFYVMSLFNHKIRLGLYMRSKIEDKRPWIFESNNSKPIWIHAASGEFEYAKPVIRELKTKYPNIKILVTYFSPSVHKSIKEFPGIDFSCPSPWDLPETISEFIQIHNPRALLLSRTDTWPEMLYQCKKRQIPTLLFSSTLSDTSSRINTFTRFFYRWLLGLLTQIFVVTEDDAKNYEAIGVRNFEVTGDTRYDQIFYRLQNPKPIKTEIFSTTNKTLTFIAGSTWPEDEIVLISAIKTLQSLNLNLRFILVPHEPTKTHIKHLQESLPNALIYSQSRKPLDANDVLIVDQLGILAELYLQSNLAFVGGSFSRNIHSVMEALAAGNPTIMGPNYYNNREAIEFSTVLISDKITATASMKNSGEIIQFITHYLSLPELEKSRIKTEIISKVRAKQGSSHKVIAWLAHFIES